MQEEAQQRDLQEAPLCLYCGAEMKPENAEWVLCDACLLLDKKAEMKCSWLANPACTDGAYWNNRHAVAYCWRHQQVAHDYL